MLTTINKYLKKRIVEINAVRAPEDVWFDDYGNLVWTVKDPNDGIPDSEKRIIYFDGHTDTVRALRDQWLKKNKWQCRFIRWCFKT